MDKESALNREDPASHQEALSQVCSSVSELLQEDPLLCDLPSHVTLEEVNHYIALEYGQAMTVNICRMDGETMPIIITQTATVLDLKHAIKRYFVLRQTRNGGKPHISWKYVWKRYWLYFNGQKLNDDRKMLKEYGIRNRDEVTFVKRLQSK